MLYYRRGDLFETVILEIIDMAWYFAGMEKCVFINTVLGKLLSRTKALILTNLDLKERVFQTKYFLKTFDIFKLTLAGQ